MTTSPPTGGARATLAMPESTPGYASSPRRYRAQRTAFSSRQAIVIGPTPPGTGVMKPATSAAPGSTSPTRPASVRFDADVDHDAAGLHHVGGHHAGHADRGDEHVGRRACARRGPSCASGRPSPSRSPAAAGAPSACRRSRCGRSRPRARRSSSIACSASIAITPSGVAGTSVCSAEVQLAGVERVEAVDVLRGRERADHLRLVDLLRQRQLHEDRVDVADRRRAPRPSRAGRPRWSPREAGGRWRRCLPRPQPCA